MEFDDTEEVIRNIRVRLDDDWYAKELMDILRVCVFADSYKLGEISKIAQDIHKREDNLYENKTIRKVN